MPYQIRDHNPVPQHPIDLSECEYQQIINASEEVLTALRAEQRFSIVVLNYFELEELFLRYALEEMCAKPYTRSSKFIERLVDAERVIGNLLSSCRMLVDQHKASLRKLFGVGSHQEEKFNKKYMSLRENDFEFSLVEYCRNISQHTSLLSSGFGHSSVSHRLQTDLHYREHTSVAWLDITTVLADTGVQKHWPDEWKEKLRNEPDRSITLLMRQYLERIWTLHSMFCVFTHTRFDKQCDVISSAIASWESANSTLRTERGLFVGPVEEKATDGHFITKYFGEQYKFLQDQWLLNKLGEKYVSSHPNLQSIDLVPDQGQNS